MKKTIVAATVAASIAVGGLTGAVLGTPVNAGAAEETATGAVSWIADALKGLVSDGMITEEQADAVETALAEARPDRGGHPGHRGGFGGPMHLSGAAEALGLSEDELRDRLGDGETIAEIASAEGVEVQSVIDALVAAAKERIDAQVTDGKLTQDAADERVADLEERVTAMVNGEMPKFGPPGPGRGRHPRGVPGDEVEADQSAA